MEGGGGGGSEGHEVNIAAPCGSPGRASYSGSGHPDRRGGTKLQQRSAGGSTRTCYPRVSRPARKTARSLWVRAPRWLSGSRQGRGAPRVSGRSCPSAAGAAARLAGRHLLAGSATGVPAPRPPGFPTHNPAPLAPVVTPSARCVERRPHASLSRTAVFLG